MKSFVPALACLLLLTSTPAHAESDAAAYFQTGKNAFLSGDYKKAADLFEKAANIAPVSAEYQLWLGRAWGRRAETGGWLSAFSSAGKARQSFEKAVALDPHSRDARDDLFDFYLHAPAALGGGIDKAEAAARSIEKEMPAEYESEEAQLADRRNDRAGAEAHLRRALDLAPGNTDCILDLARYLARQGRVEESDQLFAEARKLAPNQPKVAFVEASAQIDAHRDLDRARKLLQGYLRARLTPADPPRQQAEKLLHSVGG